MPGTYVSAVSIPVFSVQYPQSRKDLTKHRHKWFDPRRPESAGTWIYSSEHSGYTENARCSNAHTAYECKIRTVPHAVHVPYRFRHDTECLDVRELSEQDQRDTEGDGDEPCVHIPIARNSGRNTTTDKMASISVISGKYCV